VTDKPEDRALGDRLLDVGESVVGALESFCGLKATAPVVPAAPASRMIVEAGGTTRATSALMRKVKLSTPEVKFVEFVAERGGEIPWDWSKCSVPVKAMIANLINGRVLIEREYLSDARQLAGSLYLRLTDEGRAIAEQLARMTVTPKEISA
jgi:hypothetical protein